MGKVNEWTPFKREGWRFPLQNASVKYIRKITTVNLFIFVVRLVQIFFEGVTVGILAYFIQLFHQNNQRVPSHFVFSLVAGVFAILTQIIYCFRYEHKLYFLWDLGVAVGFVVSFFWFYDGVGGQLTCKWGSFNPFTADRCVQTRSVFIMQIILAVLWLFTSLMGALANWRSKKELIAKVDVV